MKKIFVIYTAFVAVVFMAGLFLLFRYDSANQNMNTAEVNDIAMTAKENWGNPQSACRLAEQKGYRCAVIDADEKLIAKAGECAVRLQDAVTRREAVVPLVVNEKVMGYVIVSDGAEHIFLEYQKKIAALFCIIAGVLLVLTALYFIFLLQRLVKPFEKLKRFAGHVAQGNLDIPLEMDRNNIFGEFTESFDIMREELATAKRLQYEAEKSKKELIASLSHDIKTPVASIRAAVELLQITTKDEKAKDKLVGIERKTDQIELLINNLFHATLEELQELEVKPEEESSKILEELLLVSDYSGLMEPFSIPECLVYVDKLRIGQVFDNIISNSYKYANTSIIVESSILDNALNIRVRDFGQSLSEQDLRHCTDKFYRGRNKEGINGAGLGLYISSFFMKKMGGV